MCTQHLIFDISVYQILSRHGIGYPLYTRVLQKNIPKLLRHRRIRIDIYCAYACESRGSAAGIYLDSVACT